MKQESLIGTGILIGLAGLTVSGISIISAKVKKTEPSKSTSNIADILMILGIGVAFLGWQKAIKIGE